MSFWIAPDGTSSLMPKKPRKKNKDVEVNKRISQLSVTTNVREKRAVKVYEREYRKCIRQCEKEALKRKDFTIYEIPPAILGDPGFDPIACTCYIKLKLDASKTVQTCITGDLSLLIYWGDGGMNHRKYLQKTLYYNQMLGNVPNQKMITM